MIAAGVPITALNKAGCVPPSDVERVRARPGAAVSAAVRPYPIFPGCLRGETG